MVPKKKTISQDEEKVILEWIGGIRPRRTI